jgi:hypothetical protein
LLKLNNIFQSNQYTRGNKIILNKGPPASVVAISCSIIYCSCRLCLWISSELAHLLRVSLCVLPVLQGLLNLEVEVVEVTHVGLDLVERQLDQHTGDLWRLFVTNKLLHELVDGVTNLVL